MNKNSGEKAEAETEAGRRERSHDREKAGPGGGETEALRMAGHRKWAAALPPSLEAGPPVMGHQGRGTRSSQTMGARRLVLPLLRAPEQHPFDLLLKFYL